MIASNLATRPRPWLISVLLVAALQPFFTRASNADTDSEVRGYLDIHLAFYRARVFALIGLLLIRILLGQNQQACDSERFLKALRYSGFRTTFQAVH
jgi:hypothetical protein